MLLLLLHILCIWNCALIPEYLQRVETQVYQKLIAVAQRHEKSGQKPRPIVVITDVGKDYDDLAALTVLKELHRLRFVELRAVVANLMPSDKRARFARNALDSLGLEDTEVPVARGTSGSLDEHEELAHEFSGTGFVAKSDQSAGSPQDGQDLLFHIYQNARSMGEKLYLLCLSSLQDINEFASNHPELVAENTAEVHMQGGNYISKEGNLEPDCKAANNRFNLDAAKEWHHFIQTNGIPSYTYTKIAAFAAPLISEVFLELEATGHPIGAYLRRVQVEQDLAFYKRACENDSEKRFAPFMDQKWFLANKTNWHLRPHPSDGDALPTGEEVIPYLTKIVLYDVHAALGVAGEDVISELNIFKGKVRCIEIHKAGSKVVGRHRISCDDQSTMDPDEVNATVVALSALMKGSLLAVQEGLPSKKFEVGFSLHNSVSPVTRNIMVSNLTIEMLPQEKIRGRKKGKAYASLRGFAKLINSACRRVLLPLGLPLDLTDLRLPLRQPSVVLSIFHLVFLSVNLSVILLSDNLPPSFPSSYPPISHSISPSFLLRGVLRIASIRLVKKQMHTNWVPVAYIDSPGSCH
ncbi:hypothetical protein KC19_3G247800 [Ceratodon purpureus]|uniref:Inosine/uridine-preferring nucleoside hydrolase domain-containing protein n=1 Tax=Ceratodon purpureus TaxID=3225 RepID=A0A8T0IPL9_CERPU|nr:hypothetical protein KC19_3G247800 [Ceratodon purpureus]